MKKFILIDSNALVHRAFHALPPLSSPSGKQTNAVYGFTSVLLKMISDLKPDYMIATFDLAGPTFRHDAYDQYKAHRVKAPDELYAQIPDVKRMLTAFGIPIIEHAGFEADDVIGTLSTQSRDMPGLQTIIVTGDLDTLQLVDEQRVVVFTLRKGMTDTVTYDEAGVRERYGIPPSLVADLKGLKGDPSDNIPGVSGIGEKTASTLVQRYGTLEELYRELENPAFATGKESGVSEKLKAKLIEQKDMAFFSKKLSTIIRDVPVTFDISTANWREHINTLALEELCKELGFFTLIKRIHTTLNPAIKAASEQTLDFEAPTTSPVASTATPLTSIAELGAITDVAIAGVIHDGQLEELYLTVDGATVYSISKPTTTILEELTRSSACIIGHDLKTLIESSAAPLALTGTTLFDTRIAAWLTNPELKEYDLGRVAYDLAGLMISDDNAESVRIIWKLKSLLAERITAHELNDIFQTLEMPLVPILTSMEHAGIQVDANVIDELLTMARTDVASLEERIYASTGTTFNINSPSQLGEVLFTKLGLKGKVRRTGGGVPSTAAAELEKLRDEHPVIELILQYRELNKLKTTYIEPFPSLIDASGRIHTTYNQTGTATGRLSSSNPNLQNIPTRTELGQRFRAAFVAPKGFQLLSLDYSQLELRIVAHVANDATMIEAFRNGEDIHTRTASEIFQVTPNDVTKDMRRQAKVLNFGIIYGMGVLGFARSAGVSRDTAKKFIDDYFVRFSGVADYMERTKNEAFKNGYVSTLMGRRRPLPDIKSTMPQLAAQSERMAINHPIQGTGADIVKLAMIAVDAQIRNLGTDSGIRMLLQVHDELVLEVPNSTLPDLAHTIAKTMEHVVSLSVPLVVEAKSGQHWASMQHIDHVEQS